MSLRETAANGDRIETLRKLRDSLAGWVDESESDRDRAALSLRLMDVLTQIEIAERESPEQKGTALDELNALRAARVSGANGASRAKAGGRP